MVEIAEKCMDVVYITSTKWAVLKSYIPTLT